jgi:hypothetical protein
VAALSLPMLELMVVSLVFPIGGTLGVPLWNVLTLSLRLQRR